MKLLKTLFGACIVASVMLSNNALAEDKVAESTAQTMQQSQADVAGKLNINTAGAAEIQRAMIGIGAKKAEAIIQYREKHGNFTTVEQLLEVQGIGKATLEKNRDRITL